MKPLITVLAVALAALGTSAGARTAMAPATSASDAAGAATEPGTPQRSKMKTCNADAKTKSLHGDERRAFMKQCLSGKSKPAEAH